MILYFSGLVIINSLWNTSKADHNVTLASPLDQSINASVSAISTNKINLIVQVGAETGRVLCHCTLMVTVMTHDANI